MSFHDPEILLLLTLLIPLALLIRRRGRGAPAIPFPRHPTAPPLPETLRCRLARFLPYLRLLVLALGVVALARPQSTEREAKVPGKGVDLVVAFDLSSSMLAEELASRGRGESRLAMAKKVLRDFIRGRSGDRIALVAFAARPYPAAPLTLDHEWLQRGIERLEAGSIEDGTALGDAILSALGRLRDQPAPSRAVILMTDGRSNAGKVSPRVAAAAAKAMGTRVHAVGIGARGKVGIPVASPLGGIAYREVEADLDEGTLREVASISGGRYFRADDSRVLTEVFREIERLEKRPREDSVYFYRREWYPPVLLAAFSLLCLELALKYTVLRTSP